MHHLVEQNDTAFNSERTIRKTPVRRGEIINNSTMLGTGIGHAAIFTKTNFSSYLREGPLLGKGIKYASHIHLILNLFLIY